MEASSISVNVGMWVTQRHISEREEINYRRRMMQYLAELNVKMFNMRHLTHEKEGGGFVERERGWIELCWRFLTNIYCPIDPFRCTRKFNAVK